MVYPWYFLNWTENGTVVSNSSSYIFTVTTSRNLVANFSQQSVLITAEVNPINGGITSGGGYYGIGSQVTVTATPNSNYAFFNWTEFGSQVSTEPMYSFTATVNRNLTANFYIEVGIEEQEFAVAIFPNPTTGMIKIQSDRVIEKIEIYSSIGFQVIQSSFNEKTVALELSRLNRGVYYLKLSHGEQILIRKIVLL
jgi:hypothetical protein